MVDSGIEGVDCMCINTDAQALKHSKMKMSLQIGSNITKGLGAGADPEVGRQAAMEDRDRIVDVSWGEETRGYSVPIQVVGSGARKLLQEVARVVEEEKAKLLGTNVSTSPADRLQTILATLEIGSASQIKRILQRIKGLPLVSEARRLL